MRVASLSVAVILLTQPAIAGQPTASSQDSSVSSSEDASTRDLPVSVERIRETLSHFPQKPLLRGLNEQPDFTVTVEERGSIELTLEEFFKNTDFSGGPVPPGGLYGYEQQRQLADPNSRPLAQPYAAFTRGELAQVAATSVLTTLLARYFARGFQNVMKSSADRAADEEVRQAIAEYCAAQPGRGQGIVICSER